MLKLLPITCLSFLCFGHQLAEAMVLYETDFESFPVGDNKWANFDGWLSNDTSSGAQAIDQDIIVGGGLGRTAALGFKRPNFTFTSVFRPINYDPAVGGNPLIEFQTLFGIEDSTNGRRDNFFISFYNINGNLLASLRLANGNNDFGIWRRTGAISAGATESATAEDFIRGELHNLNARIDLVANTWTATLDGLPLFQNAVFNTTSQALTLGPVSAEWQLASALTSNWGDNWMLVADLRVETVDELPPVIDSIVRNPSNSRTVTWNAFVGYNYWVEYSSNSINWFSDLPDSSFGSPTSATTMEFVDRSAPSGGERFYRVRRTPVAGGLTSTAVSSSRDSAGEVVIEWQAEAGFSYMIEFANRLQGWASTLPNSSFPSITTNKTLTFTDKDAKLVKSRFYRLVRTKP